MSKVKPPSKREIKDAAVAQVLRVLREFRAKQPDADVYAAAYYMFYCDGSWVSWPMVAIGTEENLLRDDGTVDEGLRWSSADWGYDVEADDAEDALAKRVHDYALTLGVRTPTTTPTSTGSCVSSRKPRRLRRSRR